MSTIPGFLWYAGISTITFSAHWRSSQCISRKTQSSFFYLFSHWIGRCVGHLSMYLPRAPNLNYLNIFVGWVHWIGNDVISRTGARTFFKHKQVVYTREPWDRFMIFFSHFTSFRFRVDSFFFSSFFTQRFQTQELISSINVWFSLQTKISKTIK